ncbi:hypothetical protein N018_12085 [Pseudomonas syringae CC1557]|uniref:Uncharacterized protein n=1 Tax=Pseudomonas syringae CC1557 TaxID=1357279 RepID=W0MYA5_PSESX|nr:hypothetical protein N018_12085 [Pseudomonas syringae CC1557]
MFPLENYLRAKRSKMRLLDVSRQEERTVEIGWPMKTNALPLRSLIAMADRQQGHCILKQEHRLKALKRRWNVFARRRMAVNAE